MEKFMGIMKHAIAIVLFTMLCACMGLQKTEFTEAMDKWKGRSADDLVNTFGIPYNAYDEESGRKVLEYFKNKKGKAMRKQRILPNSREESQVNKQINNESLQGYTDSVWLVNQMSQANHKNQYNFDQQDPYDQHLESTSNVQLFCKIRFNVSADNIVVSWSKEGRVCD